MVFGEIILAIINFLTVPTWHLVAFFIVLFVIAIAILISRLGF